MKKDLSKYCMQIKCIHRKGLQPLCNMDIEEQIRMKRCCPYKGECTCLPKGYQDTLHFFIWKKELDEEIRNEM